MEQNLTAWMDEIADRQQANERQLSDLSALVKALEARIVELSSPSETRAATATAPSQATPAISANSRITPEILLILGAAATAYLGKEVRIRSATKLQPASETINPWAQQGRAFIQGSHNMRSRR